MLAVIYFGMMNFNTKYNLIRETCKMTLHLLISCGVFVNYATHMTRILI
jgi:hypothetical protein